MRNTDVFVIIRLSFVTLMCLRVLRSRSDFVVHPLARCLELLRHCVFVPSHMSWIQTGLPRRTPPGWCTAADISSPFLLTAISSSSSWNLIHSCGSPSFWCAMNVSPWLTLERQPQADAPEKTRNCLASNNRPLTILAGAGRKKISRTMSREQSKPLVHCAKCMVRRRWSCKLQCLYIVFTAHLR